MSSAQDLNAPLPDNTFTGKMPRPPVFTNKLEEREFLKFRLAQAFRIFGLSSRSPNDIRLSFSSESRIR
jgi:hypothetical protein